MNTPTEESFARFMGTTPYRRTAEVSRLLEDLERRDVVWITKLSDPPFKEIRDKVAGRSVLALGSCEGNLEWHLAAAGAARVVGVEGYDANYRKCGVLKALFPTLRLEFHLADVENLDLSPEFDVIVCPGVLYHLRRPERLLARLRTMNPARLFLSTQLASNPPHPAFRYYRLGEVGAVEMAGRRYHGRWCPDPRGGPRDYRSGLHGAASFWFFPGDLRQLLGDLGFTVATWGVADLGDRGLVALSELRTPGHH